MKYAAGECTYCGRVMATAIRFGRPTCPESEAEACFTLWEARANAMFATLEESIGNDHGK